MKVLYIAGAGRSGSTLLEMTLGNLPGYFSVGEVRYFWQYAHYGGRRCGCGEELKDCQYWTKVLAELREYQDQYGVANLAASLDRTRKTYALLQQDSSEIQSFLKCTEALYRKIWMHSGQQIIVDSSKVPSHLALLSRIPNIELYVLHLVRDGRAVAYSWSRRQKKELARTGSEKMPYRSPTKSGIAWVVENAWASYLGKEAQGYKLIRYEDLTQDLQGQVQAALTSLGLPMGSTIAEINANPQFTHSVGGNPVRFAQSSRQVITDEEWRYRLPTPTKLSLTLLTAPSLIRYGYHLWY